MTGRFHSPMLDRDLWSERVGRRVYPCAPFLAMLLIMMSSAAAAATHHVALLPSASEAFRDGRVRILNHSDEPGEVDVTAIDDSGVTFGPVTLSLEARQAIEFGSTDLERGNAANGIATGIGGGQGDWRLILETDLEIEPFVYVQTPAGFLDGLGHPAPRRSYYHRVPLLAPSARWAMGGRLRLINRSDRDADAVVFALDDTGRLAPGWISAVLPGGGARTFDALELQRGAPGFVGQLGDGEGDWRLLVFTEGTVDAMALLDSPAGPLANLSASAVSDGEIPLFPPAGDPMREGELRIASRAGEGNVLIHAVDDAGERYGPVALNLESGRTVSLNSNDLEHGNAARGLPSGIGNGDGEWHIRLQSTLELDTVAYVRTSDGFVTSTGNAAARSARRHYVPWFNPAGETRPRSRLRLINESAEAAEVAILAWDDEGVSAPGGAVGLTLPSGASRSIGAAALEDGADGLTGQFDRGQGRWRLAIRSDRAIRAMNLVESADGHLTNLGTSGTLEHFPDACFDGPDADGDGVSDACEAAPPRRLLRAGGCSDGRFIDDPGGNAGLVGDCRALVDIVNVLADGGLLTDDHAMRRWGVDNQTKLSSWEGVGIDGGRVTSVNLAGSRHDPGGLTGPVPLQFARLSALTSLDLSYNRLTGPIPAALARLSRLETLDLSFNRLSGEIPAELAGLSTLRELNLNNNRQTGTVPWVFRERALHDGLVLLYGGNPIAGLEAPPLRGASPVFSSDPTGNGNASHRSIAYYQGALVWSWNWTDEAVEHQRPVLGRWAALAVRVEHETPEPPLVATRVLDDDGAVLAGSLEQAAPPITESAGSGRWRTQYVFDLPGALYRAGNRIVHVIDPDDDMPETDEADNVGEPVVLYGIDTPRLRMTFIPVHFPGQAASPLDAGLLMRGIRAFWPVADDFEALVGEPLETVAANQYELLAEVRARWNAEADEDEFYYGIFSEPWTGGRGVAYRPGRVAVSELSEFNTIPHEFGHNLNLRHPPGCDVRFPDRRYPYPNGQLGPHSGWDANWRRVVSQDDEAYADVMSYCGRYRFVSDYHYRKALQYWSTRGFVTPAAAGLSGLFSGGSPMPGPASAGRASAGALPSPLNSQRTGAIALSGRIDANGVWSLTHAQATTKGPRPPAPNGMYTLVLFDGDGRELYREALTADALSDGGESGWAARVPAPPRAAAAVAILNGTGEAVLREALPGLD